MWNKSKKNKKNNRYLLLFFIAILTVLAFIFIPESAKAEENDYNYKPIYRFWSKNKKAHFFTLEESEKGEVINRFTKSEWNFERIAFSGIHINEFNKNDNNLAKVYRFWSNKYNSHFYTVDPEEKQRIIREEPFWNYEWEAFAVFKNKTANSIPVYRFWSNNYKSHFFTTDENEKKQLINHDPNWKYEWIAFFVDPQSTNLVVDPVSHNCPIVSKNCVPCTSKDPLCRIQSGKTSGFQGWACQNNNPGNIRYSSMRNDLITAMGGEAACGERNTFMVFRDYDIGLKSLKAYIKAINAGMHSSYPECGDCSLKYFFSKYAPAGDQNDPNSYSSNVAASLGISNEAKLNWIVEKKLDEFTLAIKRQEGWFEI
jgi:hypothetical protein